MTYFYDAAGQLEKVQGSGLNNGSVPWTLDYLSEITYDLFGNRTHAKYGNGLESTWSYDPLTV